MNSEIIYDIGLHQGQDTEFYLKQGYSVVGIDADPEMISAATKKFSAELETKQLTLLNNAVSDKEGETLTLYRSENSAWNSLNQNIASREGLAKESIEITSRRLDSLFAEFGLPIYCKVDVEGYDIEILKTLSPKNELPRFFSVESECGDDENPVSEEDALGTLDELARLGYKKFKLIEQLTLNELRPNEVFFRTRSWLENIGRTLKLIKGEWRHRENLIKRFQHDFKVGGTGPFGHGLEGSWLSYEQAKETLIFHRRAYFSLPKASNFGFWCDWHAMK